MPIFLTSVGSMLTPSETELSGAPSSIPSVSNLDMCAITDRGPLRSSGRETFELYELGVSARGSVARPVFALAGVTMSVRAPVYIYPYSRQISAIAFDTEARRRPPAISANPMTGTVSPFWETPLALRGEKKLEGGTLT